MLRSWVRIPPGAWIFVCCECRVLSGRGLCEELITRPEESYRLCCVVVCDLETSRTGAPYIYDISRLRVNSLSAESLPQRKEPPYRSCFQSNDVIISKIFSCFNVTNTASGRTTELLLSTWLIITCFTSFITQKIVEETLTFQILMYRWPCISE